MTVKMIGIIHVIIFCCIGSMPGCCGMIRCCTIISAPSANGRM